MPPRRPAARSPTRSRSRPASPTSPQDHDGSSAFTFTKDVSISAANMRDHAFTVTGGDVDPAAKVNGSSKQWLKR